MLLYVMVYSQYTLPPNEPVIGTLIHYYSILFQGFQGLFLCWRSSECNPSVFFLLVLAYATYVQCRFQWSRTERPGMSGCFGLISFPKFFPSMFQHVFNGHELCRTSGRHWICRSWLDCWKFPSLHSTASGSTSPEIHCAMTTCRWPQLQRCACHHVLYQY